MRLQIHGAAFYVLGGWCLGINLLCAAAPDEKGTEFFEKKIRPLLVERCYECHSTEKGKTKGGLTLDSREALLQGGDSGPALVAGSLEKSKLIEGIRYQNRDFQMPPKKPLSSQEVADLETWVKMGAPDPRGKSTVAATKGRRVIDLAEGRKFWSFQPLADPAVPRVQDAGWVRSPIDAFILAKLADQGLHPAPPADKRTLIRRATFDLVGLPPTPEEVDAFLNDAAPDSFARVIERLLRSPAYGERWGRHWLDLARYADSNGMDENVAFGHSWRYRDYVVRAFNDDKPFDQFLIEQLAGDLLPAPSKSEHEERLAATGFLALGAKVLAEPDLRKLEMDIIDEQLDTLGKAFLGMTFGCCRCHDHKFDPIPTTDYYAMAAILHNTKSLSDDRKGSIKYWYEHPLATPAQIAAKKAHDVKVSAQKKKVADYIAKTRADLKEDLHSHAADYLAASAMLDADCGYEDVARAAREWPQKGGEGSLPLRPRYLLMCRQYLARNKEHPFFAKWHELTQSRRTGDVAAHYSPLFTEARAAMKTAKAKDAKATTLHDARLDPALEALNDIAGFLAIPDKDADAFDSIWFSEVDQMNDELARLERDTPDLPAIMAVADDNISRTLPVHIRGSHLTLGPEIERGFPEVMRVSLTKPIFPAKQSGRLELARWMAGAEHPLTARVLVNRVWRWHFGKGIVSTTDNFGTLGDRPSHPELLDWLARRFIEDGWSIKDLHRLMMNSACYQESSSNSEAGIRKPELTSNSSSRAEQTEIEAVNERDPIATDASIPNSEFRIPTLIDPENRLLWHFNIQRLEAEQIRDALLAVSGWLEPQVGGKTIPLHNREFVFNHTSKDHITYESPRRALYLPVIRNHLYDMLEQFDYPDPTMPTGSRNATVVAPQALIMLNAEITMDAADKLASAVLKGTTDDAARVQRAYVTLYGRPAGENEVQRALAFVNQQTGRRQSWALLCQTLMAANEFMYLR